MLCCVLQVDIQESGEGQGGYAKEMSKEFIEAEVGAQQHIRGTHLMMHRRCRVAWQLHIGL